MIRSAAFNEDKTHRHYLGRFWDPYDDFILYIGLNPSTADAYKDDPTIKRWINFSRRFGHGGFVVVNLFSYRTSSPTNLQHYINKGVDPLDDNWCDYWIGFWAEKAHKIVACWGNVPWAETRVLEVLQFLIHCPLYCFGHTQNGYPKHPLYLAKDTQLEPLRFRG